MVKPPTYLSKPIPVLYEDERFIVFDKPAGLLTIATPQKEENTLVRIVNYQYKNNPPDVQSLPAGTVRQAQALHPCHRLDRDTSGIIIFAKGKANQKRMMDLFKYRKIHKQYIAFIQGNIHRPSGEIKGAVEPHHHRRHRGKKYFPSIAITRYKVVEHRPHFSILEVEPLTGKTNQIRIHFSQVGHPLVGDRKYSIAKNFPIKFRRSALHATHISWPDPKTGKTIIVKSPLPEDMEVFLDRDSHETGH